MSASVIVRPVETASDQKAFFEFPWMHYKGDQYWVPPLLSMRHELLSKSKNPAWEYMEGQYFTAWQGDRIVGIVTAFINHRHNEFWGEKVGWFGTFETINDPAVAKALLDTACQWVKQKGFDKIRGPQSFTTHEEVGLQIAGFGQPVLLMPYNKTYYQALVEEQGFTKSMDVISMYFGREMEAKTGMASRLKKLSDRARERSNITVRPLDGKHKKEEFKIFRDIYNDAWDKNWGFVPMNDRELDALVASLGMFVEPEMAFFAEVDGEPAGFALALPDFNELLKKVQPRPGVPEIWSLLKLLWYWKGAKIVKGLRLPLMGVRAKYRDKGIDLALLSECYEKIPLQYSHIDCGWILETNQLVKMSVKLGADPYRTHRLYEKNL